MIAFLHHPYFVQGLGVIAFVLGVSSFLSKDDKRLKLLLAGQCFVLSIHFYFLGAMAGSGMTFVGGWRNLLSINGTRLRPFAVVFIVFYLGLGVYNFETWVDVLPMIASILATCGLFYLEKIPMRLCFVAGSFLWLVHNITVGSIGPSFMEAMMLCATLRTIYMLYKDAQKSKLRS